MCHTINEFPGMMEEVMDFIQEWPENWTCTYEFMWDGYPYSLVPAKHILVAAQKGKVIEIRERLDVFAKNFDWALLIEIQSEQGLVSMLRLIVLLVWCMMPAAMADSITNL